MESLFQDAPGEKNPAHRHIESTAGGNLPAILKRLSEIADELGEEFSNNRKRLGELRERLVEERFHLAVLGQFKRGKSTLLNALLGEALLPTSVLPVTSVPTFLRFGLKRNIRVSFRNGRREEFSDLPLERAAEILAAHVTEEGNPKNKLGVATVEADHPSSLLSQGVVLIDTPGIGSTFRHNTDTTLNFLPQCDAALFVVSADPPMTEVELEFLKAVRGKVARVFFVMNKADYLTPQESGHAVEFLREVICKEAGFEESVHVYCVSARQGLGARAARDCALWEQSGLAQVENRLREFFTRDKGAALQAALAKKSLDLLDAAAMHMSLRRRSLEMPLRELEERANIFDQKVREIEHERDVLADLLAGDRKRTREFLEEQAEKSRAKSRGRLEVILDEALRSSSVDAAEGAAQERLAEEIPPLFAEELISLDKAIDGRTQELLRAHQERADELMETVRRTAAELFDIPHHAPDSDGALQRTHKPYWVTYNWDTLISPIPTAWTQKLLPAGMRQRRLRKKLFQDRETLVVHNVENIRWATLRNLEATFRRFSEELDERFQATAEATRGAILAARRRRTEQETTAQPELERLQRRQAEVERLREALTRFTPRAENG